MKKFVNSLHCNMAIYIVIMDVTYIPIHAITIFETHNTHILSWIGSKLQVYPYDKISCF